MLPKHFRWTVWMLNLRPFGNYMVFIFIWNAFEDTLFQLIVYTWKMYDMQTLLSRGHPHVPGNISTLA